MYWVCTWFTTNSTAYISDAFQAGTFTGGQVGPGQLEPPFRKFLIARYAVNPQSGSANCIYKFSEADARMYLQQHIAHPQSGMHIVQTGWKYGMTDSGGAAPATQGGSAPAAAAPAAAYAPVPSAPGPPVTTSITVRLVDSVNSSTDPAGKQYRAVVTKEASAGAIQIPQNTLAKITLAQQAQGTFSAQLVSLRLNGQDVAVTSSTASAMSMAQQTAKKIGGILSSIGKQAAGAQASSAINTAGNHVAIPPGTSLTFSTAVPQPGASTANAAPPAAAQEAIAAAPASQQANQPYGEQGADGQVIGGSMSGVMTAYYCTAEVIPPGKHRQTTYVTAPFNSAQPQLWITFWYSQHIHQTYNIPAYVQNFTVDCNTYGNKTAAQQQADINRWKERNDDVVQLHWVPTQTPTPGVSVSQLNNRTGQMMTGAIGSNMPPNTNPAGSVALCNVTAIDGKHYVSSVFPVGNQSHTELEFAFSNYVATKYNHGRSLGDAGCFITTATHGETMRQQWNKDYATHGIAHVDTGWSYSGPEPGPLKLAQSSPAGFVLCSTSGGNEKKAYTSAIFKAGSEEPLVMQQAFLAYLVTKYGPNVSHNTTCSKDRYLDDPQHHLAAMKNQGPGFGITVVETGWTYNGAEPVTAANSGGGDANPEAAAAGQYVLCYSDVTLGSMYMSANFHIDVPPTPDPHSTHTDHGRSAQALADLRGEFLRFLQKQYGYHSNSSYPAYCDGSSDAGKPDDERQVLHQRFSQAKMIETGWKPGTTPPPVAAGIPKAPANPYSSAGGVYTGTYTCAKGPVDMQLKLSLNESSILTGTMTIYLPPGSHTKAYRFSLGGPLNQNSGSFTLRPMKWETEAPPNYVLVGFIGTMNPQSGRVSGKVDYSGCGNFEAMKGRED